MKTDQQIKELSDYIRYLELRVEELKSLLTTWTAERGNIPVVPHPPVFQEQLEQRSL